VRLALNSVRQARLPTSGSDFAPLLRYFLLLFAFALLLVLLSGRSPGARLGFRTGARRTPRASRFSTGMRVGRFGSSRGSFGRRLSLRPASDTPRNTSSAVEIHTTIVCTGISIVLGRVDFFETARTFVADTAGGSWELGADAVAVLPKARDEFIVLGRRICTESSTFDVRL
jgi:hypothetical protein